MADGGGVRGYSMLIILQELMYRVYVECEGKAPRRDEIPKPCDHFDLIVGTGTGGLIALMLGRLRLDLETCKDVYVRMTRRVFETDKTFAGIPFHKTLFKASKLEEAIRECVREHTVFEAEGNDMSPSARNSLASAPFSPNSMSVPQRSGSRASFSTTTSHSSGHASQRNSTFVNGLRWGNPDALLYDNREYRTKTYVYPFHYFLAFFYFFLYLFDFLCEYMLTDQCCDCTLQRYHVPERLDRPSSVLRFAQRTPARV